MDSNAGGEDVPKGNVGGRHCGDFRNHATRGAAVGGDLRQLWPERSGGQEGLGPPSQAQR